MKLKNRLDWKRSINIREMFKFSWWIGRNKLIDGVINCSIDKRFWKRIGVTDIIKRNNLDNKEVMLIFNKKLSVYSITTHINLDSVQKNISKDK